MSTLLITNGRVLDPCTGRDAVCDVFVKDGIIAAIGTNLDKAADEVLDATGFVVTPGLVDLQVHFREPGREDKETIETGSRACLAGGITSAVSMPNTEPVADSQSVIEFIQKRSRELGLINIFPAGSITKNQEGTMLSEMWELKRSGAVAVTDDGADVQDAGILLKAMEYAKTHDLLVMSHCETECLTGEGVIHEGWVSTQLGLPSTPEVAEDLAVAKNIMLSKRSGVRLHLLHNSTKGAIRAIRQAKQEGYRNITAEVSVQHFALTDEECLGYNTNTKMYPPLRSREHVEVVIGALKDGTIDAITTDHAPHIEPDKLKPFSEAAFGSVGVETSFAVMYTYLVLPGYLSLAEGIALMTYKPAAIIRKSKGTLAVGSDADVTIFDLNKVWNVDPERFYSKGKNSVFANKELTGKAICTIVGGQVKMRGGVVF